MRCNFKAPAVSNGKYQVVENYHNNCLEDSQDTSKSSLAQMELGSGR